MQKIPLNHTYSESVTICDILFLVTFFRNVTICNNCLYNDVENILGKIFFYIVIVERKNNFPVKTIYVTKSDCKISLFQNCNYMQDCE